MSRDSLEQTLFAEICKIPLIDPHSHINPHQPAAKSLDDILGYHYYTELAHSAGMDKKCLSPDFDPKERVRTILSYMERFDNTVQYSWFLEIARTFLGFDGDRVTAADCDWLWTAAEKQFGRPDWEEHVLKTTNVEKIFLTNDFDDPLEGFDTGRYVPCLRVDELVFNFRRETHQRLTKSTGVQLGDMKAFRAALASLFERFVKHNARACAVSLPPNFSPMPIEGSLCEEGFSNRLAGENVLRTKMSPPESWAMCWLIAEQCAVFKLPFDLMIGVNRRVYENGVHQGQDLFDQRTSLIQYRELFNAFPEVTFAISVLSTNQNQELASFSWIFPNVVTNGHWWYSNIPAYIENDCRARLQAVPKTKQIGYYSDAYKLEFILPKFNMYRRILARILAADFIRDRGWSETQAIELARLLLRGNIERIFKV